MTSASARPDVDNVAHDGHASVVSVAVTAAGRRLASRLPFQVADGGAAEAVRAHWGRVDGLVLFIAAGAAVRLIAPLLADKATDPGVVCVDEAGRFAVALTGGHRGGANDLARRVASLLGAEPVVTTATDAVGVAALDALPGWRATGDVAGVTTAMLDGAAPTVLSELAGWDPPEAVVAGDGPHRVVVSDRTAPPRPGTVYLRPPSLVVGVGCSSDATAEEASALVAEALADAGLAPEAVSAAATITSRAAHPAVVGLDLPVAAFDAADLARVEVPNPSPVVEAAVGTPSVAEAAALLAAGPGAELVAPKSVGARVTAAVARRARPRGRVVLVGLGPGDAAHRTPAAEAAVRGASTVIGYTPYVDQAADLLGAGQRVVRSPIGQEVARAEAALAAAGAGETVAVVCSGDAGVYAMASIVAETAGDRADIDIEVVPGVTAALTSAALLGAPLGHDHALISLSDLLTPWETIIDRVAKAAEGDFVVVFYNPRSRGRDWQLGAAMEVLGRHRPLSTPVGVVTDAGRPGQRVELCPLERFDPASVGMTSCVVVGSSTTRIVGGRMVTPRGYLDPSHRP